MAPLKVEDVRFHFLDISLYAWLRRHGSIEGILCQISTAFQAGVSMAERSWLH